MKIWDIRSGRGKSIRLEEAPRRNRGARAAWYSPSTREQHPCSPADLLHAVYFVFFGPGDDDSFDIISELSFPTLLS